MSSGAGQNAYATLGNQAEGCAPLSVLALAQVVRELRPGVSAPRADQITYVTLSNQAEGCAPLSVLALAQAVRELRQ